jgi:hypothetical protein
MRYVRPKEKRRGRQGGPLRKACLLSAESVLWICEAAFASTTSSMLAAAIAGLYIILLSEPLSEIKPNKY